MTALETKIDLGGTVRARTPEQTLARLEPLLPRFGITRWADVTRLDTIGIPVVMCIRPNAKTLAVSQGKGASLPLAAVSAIMESIEIWHSETATPDRRTTARALTDAGRAYLDPARLDTGPFQSAFDVDVAIDWADGFDLATQGPIAVPFGCVSMNLCDLYEGVHVVPRNTNGLASGNVLDEAILHALCEVLERDSEWRFRALDKPGQRARLVDQDTIDEPGLCALLDQYAAAGVHVAIWDMTSALGVPAYRCGLLDGDDWRGLSRFYGAGCHPSRTVAMSRALTEAAQCRLTYISGARDDMLPSGYHAIAHNRDAKPAVDHPPGTWDFHATTSIAPGATFAADCANVLDRLASEGFDHAVAVDLSRSEYDGIAVAKVVVPGMRRVH